MEGLDIGAGLKSISISLDRIHQNWFQNNFGSASVAIPASPYGGQNWKIGKMTILGWDSPDPRQGPASPFPGKGSFLSKNPLFSTRGTHRKWGFLDRKLPFPGLVRARGNGGFWTPKPSFPGNGDSSPCLGSGESQNFGVKKCLLWESPLEPFQWSFWGKVHTGRGANTGRFGNFGVFPVFCRVFWARKRRKSH